MLKDTKQNPHPDAVIPTDAATTDIGITTTTTTNSSAGTLHKLVKNSQKAIDDGTYNIQTPITKKSTHDLIHIIKHNPHPTLITEIKLSSPSLGKIKDISKNPSISDTLISIAKQMISGGASALSVLTQPYLFDGSPQYFMKIREAVQVPMLMKDIIIHNTQIDAAQKIGADYILLIQSLFEQRYIPNIHDTIEYAHKKGLKVLLETHTKTEFANAIKTNADLIGINNRNLDTLKIDITNTKKIIDTYYSTNDIHHRHNNNNNNNNNQSDNTISKPIISESGIFNTTDIEYLKKCGASAFLVGSSIMQSNNITSQVQELVNAY